MASREADHQVFNAYTHHLRRLVEQNALQPSVFLPKRGDLLIWFVCHYTTVASHKKAQAFRVAEGFSFDSSPQPLFQRSLPGRLKARLLESLAGFRS